jgi:hypothetical protein
LDAVRVQSQVRIGLGLGAGCIQAEQGHKYRENTAKAP